MRWVGLLEACTAGVQLSQVRLGVGEGGSHSLYMPDRNAGRKSLVSREVIAALKHEELTRVVIRLWAIWYARRQALFENNFQSPFSTNSFVERFISELEMIKSSNK